jgi:pantothenate kinase
MDNIVFGGLYMIEKLACDAMMKYQILNWLNICVNTMILPELGK